MGTVGEPGRLFVGRAETVEALHRRFEEARKGAGGVTLLIGATGVGKSLLVDHLAGEIRARGHRVLIGRALQLDNPPPFSLLQSVFESLGAEPNAALAAPSRLNEGRPLPEISPGTGGSSPSPVGSEERLLEALGVTGDRTPPSRDQVLAGFADRILAYARQGPTMLILDELHRADASSLVAVEFLANRLAHRPLWILATSRPFEALSESGRARIEEFRRVTHADQLVLRPWTSGEVARYLKVADPSREFSPDEIARRYAETGGNPLLLQQLDRRISSESRQSGRPGAALPPLDPEAQRALDVAATLGPEFTIDLLLGASGEDPDDLQEAVDRLVDRGLLFERPGELLEFPEDRLREEAYRHLTESRRRLLHHLAGEARESMASGGSARIFGLARDFYLGKVDKKAVEYNRIAAEIADRAMAPDVAREFIAHALESQRNLDAEDPDAESKLVLELGRLTYELGRLEEADGILRQFLDRTRDDPRLPPRIRATLQIYLAQVLTARGDLPAAAELARKVLASPGLDDQLLVRVGAHHQLGLGLYYGGQYPEALAEHTEELRLAREVGNERVIAHAQKWRAGVLAMMGQAEQAIAGAREVAATLDRLGSPGESAQGHLFLGNMLADDKSTPLHRQEAIAELAKAVRLGEKAQDPRRVGWALYHTAELLREEGRFTEAAEKAQRAGETLGRIGDRVGQSVSTKVLGQIAMARGDYALAEADLSEAYRQLRGLNNTLNEIDVLLRLAQLSSVRGDHAGARRQVAELEQMHLRAARPDLTPELDRLKATLTAEDGEVPAGERPSAG